MRKNKEILKIKLIATVVLIFTACQQPAAPHSHSYGDWQTVKAATCTEDGTEEGTCACGDKTTRPVDKKGHTDANEDGICDACYFKKPIYIMDTNYRTGEGDTSELTVREDSVEYKLHFKFCEENMTSISGWTDQYDGRVWILTPEIKAESGEIVIDENNVELKNVDGVEDTVIYFNEMDKPNCPECRYYILYNDLKAKCDEAHIIMNRNYFTELIYKLKQVQKKS